MKIYEKLITYGNWQNRDCIRDIENTNSSYMQMGIGIFQF